MKIKFACLLIFFFLPSLYSENDAKDLIDPISVEAENVLLEGALKASKRDLIIIIPELLKKHNVQISKFNYDEIFIENGEIRIRISWVSGKEWIGCMITLIEEADGLKEVSFQLYTM